MRKSSDHGVLSGRASEKSDGVYIYMHAIAFFRSAAGQDKYREFPHYWAKFSDPKHTRPSRRPRLRKVLILPPSPQLNVTNFLSQVELGSNYLRIEKANDSVQPW